MKKVKTWTVSTYQRRTNHTLVAPDLLDKTEELSLEGMHFYLDSLAKVFEEFGYDTYYHNYELDITDKNGRNIIFRPMPATYEEVIE
jgi:hypothetical protein